MKNKIKNVVTVESKSLIPRSVILKEKLVSSVTKLLIAVIFFIIATYAWFTNNKDIGVPNLNATTSGAEQVEISLDNGITWLKTAEFDIADDFVLYKESTSEGINFYKPNIKSDDGTPINFVPAIKNEDYLEYKVLFRSLAPTTIYLEKKSDVYPAAGKNTINLINSTEIIRESPDGNFSKDLIAGAVRIAFIENDIIDEEFIEQTTPKLIWAPNKGYQVKIVDDKYYGYLDSTESQDYEYTKVIDFDSFYLESLTNVTEDINASYETFSSGDDIALTSIDTISENIEENVRAVTIRIWVEGNDREAIYSLKGGQFKIFLSFVGIF
ncbi:MAG: hypothetical protein PHD15_04860 [Clostridia bacterium]|nr:hypothetical protein [Clostridia bacterium]MDD4387070.1 hypothetical protein [Clostridia bacterium]